MTMVPSQDGAVRAPARVRSRARAVAACIAAFASAPLAGLAVSRFQQEGAGDDDDFTSTRVALHAGIGLDYWFNRSWGASMSLIDPVVGYTKYVSEQGTGEVSRTSRGFGIEFQIGGMIHLYF